MGGYLQFFKLDEHSESNMYSAMFSFWMPGWAQPGTLCKAFWCQFWLTQYVDSHLWIRSLLPLQQNARLPRVNSTAPLPFSSLMLFYLSACFDKTSVCELRHLTLVFYITLSYLILYHRRAHTNTHLCAEHLSLTAAVDVKRMTV